MLRPARALVPTPTPRLRIVKEDFEFEAALKGQRLSVIVRGVVITLRDPKGIVAAGIWDSGRYVRYERGQALADIVHPTLLDEIDRVLRGRMTTPGVVRRVDPPRRSSLNHTD